MSDMWDRLKSGNKRAMGGRIALGVESAGLGTARFAGKSASMVGRSLISANPIAMTGSFTALGLAMAPLSHDPTKNSFETHMAQEAVKIGADSVVDTGLFAAGAMFGLPGMVASTATSIAMHSLGLNPGAFAQRYMDQARGRYQKAYGQGPAPMTQNKRTIAATQRAMSMLGQNKRHSMLGSEAQYMHN